MAPRSTDDADALAEGFTRSQVAAMQSLTVVGGDVYDAKAFRSEHPGGEHFMNLFGGRDATEAFMEYHRRPWPKERMARFHVGRLAASEKPVQADPAYLELCKVVNAVVPPTGGFAPATYWLKVAFLLAGSVALESFQLLVGKSLLLSVVMGLFFAAVGLNIQHDANHGAVSKRPWVNFLLGLAQDWIGGSSILWMQEHVVLHHIFTNDVKRDPDQVGDGILRFKEQEPWQPMHRVQQWTIWILEALYAFKLIFIDAVLLFRWEWNGEKISDLARGMYWPSVTMKILFWLRFVVLPIYLEPALHTVACIAATTASASFYLAFFFFLSHNFLVLLACLRARHPLRPRSADPGVAPAPAPLPCPWGAGRAHRGRERHHASGCLFRPTPSGNLLQRRGRRSCRCEWRSQLPD